MVVGYEINNQKRYCIKYSDSIVIGAYECMYNKRSAFIYTALTEIEGFFIRKRKWEEFVLQYEQVSVCLRRNILLDYLMNIRIKVVVNKKKAMDVLKARHDQQMVKISEAKNEEHHRAIITESLNYNNDK